MPNPRVILTVDTEPSIAGALKDPARYSPLLEQPVWGEVNGRSEALGFITETLCRFDLAATFFVETVHTGYFGEMAMAPYVRHLVDKHQDVQLHIHPVWLNLLRDSPFGDRTFNDDSAALPEHELSELLKQGIEQIQRWTGQRPVALRTGNFDASSSVYRAMRQAGLELSSNLCGSGRTYAEAVLNRSGGICQVEGITELPVTCFSDQGPVGKGRLRAAQITACSAAELINLLEQCASQQVDTVVLVTHPFEFIKKSSFRYDDLRPNRLVQSRLIKLCQFLSHNRDRFEVCTFADIARQDRCSESPPPQLDGSVLHSIYRALQNVINDHL